MRASSASAPATCPQRRPARARPCERRCSGCWEPPRPGSRSPKRAGRPAMPPAGSPGTPSIPPSIMLRALLLATYERTRSDAETSRNTRVDLDWKAAMGVDDDFPGIAPTTLSLMRARMVAADADAKLFEKTLEKAVAAGIFGKEKLTAIIDSSPVYGAGAVSDTYELIRGFLRKAVKAAGSRLSVAATDATKGFLGEKPDIDWQDPAARKAHLGELVAAA